jgi:hypothetical protein
MGDFTLFNNIVISLLITSLCPLLQPIPVNAEVYKWTDENGRVYYGDRPGNDDYKRIIIRQSGPMSKIEMERVQKRQRLLEVMEEERRERNQEQQDQREARDKRRAQCEMARQNLESVLTSSYLYEETDDPLNPKILSEQERNTATLSAEKAVSEWCS